MAGLIRGSWDTKHDFRNKGAITSSKCNAWMENVILIIK